MKESSPKEIVNLIGLECRGANPTYQLDKPVSVTVDVSVGGERRVGCPYIIPTTTGDSENNEPITWRCSINGAIKTERVSSPCSHKYPH